jgi:hypothetical protein
MSAILLAAIAEEGMEERSTERIVEVLGQVMFVPSVWYSVTRWIFFLKGLINLISTFCVCSDGSQCLLNLFTTLYKYKLFFFFYEIVTGTMFSSVDPSVAARKMCQFYLSKAAFGKILQGHKRLPGCSFRFKLSLWGL